MRGPFKKKHPIRIGATYKTKDDPWGWAVKVVDYKSGWVKYKFLDEGREIGRGNSIKEGLFSVLYKVTE